MQANDLLIVEKSLKGLVKLEKYKNKI